MEVNRIYQMDCIEGLKQLEDNSIDLIIADPPYNIKKAEWDKWKNQDDYLSWMKTWMMETQRVLKDNGSFYWFHNQMPTISKLMCWLESKSDYVFKQMITWNKIDKSFNNSGFVHQRLSVDMMRNYYNGFTEYCLFYTFQDETGLTTVKLDLNNFTTLRQYFKEFQEALGCNKKEIIEQIGQCADHCFRWKSSQWDMPTLETYQELCELHLNDTNFQCREYEDLRREYEDLRREYEDLRREYEDLRYTFKVTNVKQDFLSNCNVWNYPPTPKQGHITPKPLELIKNIIKHSSNPNDTILDPFMGSGTTAQACKELNRNYIGFELEEKYVNIANERLKSIQKVLV